MIYISNKFLWLGVAAPWTRAAPAGVHAKDEETGTRVEAAVRMRR